MYESLTVEHITRFKLPNRPIYTNGKRKIDRALVYVMDIH